MIDRRLKTCRLALSFLAVAAVDCMRQREPPKSLRALLQTAATKTMKEVCGIVGNRDIEPFIPVLVSCIARPAEVPDCVHKLGATTFVQNVEAPALSIMVPLLIRGLRERATAVKRKAALIIDNMAKLVDNPSDAALFLPRLLPGLEKVSQEVPDPECRSVASKARDTLLKLVQDPAAAAPAEAHDFKVCFACLSEFCMQCLRPCIFCCCSDLEGCVAK